MKSLSEIWPEHKGKGDLIDSRSKAIAKMVADRTKDLRPEERSKVLFLFRYNARQIVTSGRNFFGQYWCDAVGARNVAESVTADNANAIVSMEQIYAWNPDVVFITNFTAATPADLFDNKMAGHDWSDVKAVKDKRLHNTKLLLQNYHCFVEHSKSAVYEASQLSEDDDFEELMEGTDESERRRVRVPVVRSIQESAAHTRIIVQHIDRMLEYYKFRCEHSKRAEEMRRYRTIYDLYIAPEPKTQQQIADEEHVDLSTVFRDQKAGISKLSALIFGWLD